MFSAGLTLFNLLILSVSLDMRKRARAGSDTASDTTVHATADSRKRDKSRNKKPRVLPATDVESMVIDPIS